jgi:hypothetical protein
MAPRKTPVAPYINITPDEAAAIVLADKGKVTVSGKEREIDLHKVIGVVHARKYVANTKINGKFNSWIDVLTKIKEGVELSSDELETFEKGKAEMLEYIESKSASDTLRKKFEGTASEAERLIEVATSMKYKFSSITNDATIYPINLMVREIIVHTNDACLAKNVKTIRKHLVPWDVLKDKALAGLYMNTAAVINAIHSKDTPEETAVEEVVPEEEQEVAEEETEDSESEDKVEDVKKPVKQKIKFPLTQYIGTTFREIKSRDERFKGLLLGTDFTGLVNDIVFQVLDRYACIIDTLLQSNNGKIVKPILSILATKNHLLDYAYSEPSSVRSIVQLIQSHVAELEREAQDKKAKKAEAAETAAETTDDSVSKGKVAKK